MSRLELDFTDGLDHTEHDAGDDDVEEDVSPMEGAPRTFGFLMTSECI